MSCCNPSHVLSIPAVASSGAPCVSYQTAAEAEPGAGLYLAGWAGPVWMDTGDAAGGFRPLDLFPGVKALPFTVLLLQAHCLSLSFCCTHTVFHRPSAALSLSFTARSLSFHSRRRGNHSWHRRGHGQSAAPIFTIGKGNGSRIGRQISRRVRQQPSAPISPPVVNQAAGTTNWLFQRECRHVLRCGSPSPPPAGCPPPPRLTAVAAAARQASTWLASRRRPRAGGPRLSRSSRRSSPARAVNPAVVHPEALP